MPEQEARARSKDGQEGGAIARVVAVGALVAGAVLVALTLLGGESGHRYTLLFETGGQLVPGNQVLVAGQAIGTIATDRTAGDGEIPLPPVEEVYLDSVPDAPDLAGDAAALTSFESTLNKGIKARCRDTNRKLNIKARFVYDDATVDNASAVHKCKRKRRR